MTIPSNGTVTWVPTWGRPTRDRPLDLSKNCTSFARFAHTIVRTTDRKTGFKNLCAVETSALHSFVLSLLRNTPRSFNESEARQEQIMSWYMLTCSYEAHSDCRTEVCETSLDFTNAVASEFEKQNSMPCITALRSELQVQGNADIAGIGVVVTFWIEAFLVTAILLAFWVEYFRPRRLEKPTILDRGLDAFKAVLPTFYWSSVLLSLGVTVASYFTVLGTYDDAQDDAIAHWRLGGPLNLFDIRVATLASILSTLPPWMSGLMLQMPGRRRRLVDFAIIPWLSVLLMPLVGGSTTWSSHLGTELDLILNFDRNYIQMANFFMITAVLVLILLMIISGLTIFFIHQLEQSGYAAPINRGTLILFLLFHSVLFTMMWTALAVYYIIRDKTINKGADGDPQLEWSFGQILALTTWVPVFMDFFYTVYAGLKKGLEGHIPGDYHVVPTIDTDESEGVPLDRES